MTAGWLSCVVDSITEWYVVAMMLEAVTLGVGGVGVEVG